MTPFRRPPSIGNKDPLCDFAEEEGPCVDVARPVTVLDEGAAEKDVVVTVTDADGLSGMMGIVFNNLAPRVGIDTDQSPLNGIAFPDADSDGTIDDVIVQSCGESVSYWVVLNVYGEFQYELLDPPSGMGIQADDGNVTFDDACPGPHDYSVELAAGNGSASTPVETVRFHVN